jgi:hypothetical protein
MFGGLAGMYALIQAAAWCRRVQVARALRKEQSLRPDHPIQIEEIVFGPRYGSVREALWASIQWDYYTVNYRDEDGSMESFSLRGVFFPFIPWLRHIDVEPLSCDRQ